MHSTHTAAYCWGAHSTRRLVHVESSHSRHCVATTVWYALYLKLPACTIQKNNKPQCAAVSQIANYVLLVAIQTLLLQGAPGFFLHSPKNAHSAHCSLASSQLFESATLGRVPNG
eukprot:GHRR01004205.1.p1 GENE.GHRR01004205.1~~GHRR01004205.1.p1  ORF type:complete len:115 (+),score=7.82 GHRR01004205.1:374-718(+)